MDYIRTKFEGDSSSRFSFTARTNRHIHKVTEDTTDHPNGNLFFCFIGFGPTGSHPQTNLPFLLFRVLFI